MFMISGLSFLALLVEGLSQEFDRDYVGVAFSPYVKFYENGQVPFYNTYNFEDIKNMIEIISTKFSSISTYGMGVSKYNKNQPWDEADGNCLIARAAAHLNKKSKKQLITMNQGVYQYEDDSFEVETNNAFSAIDEANNIYPNTVWGITFTNEYIVDARTGQRVLEMIRNNSARAKEKGIKIGVRTHYCGEIGNQNGEVQAYLINIAKESDFIMCNLYTSAGDAVHGMKVAAMAVGGYFLHLRDRFKEQNPEIDVIIGETGWPSEGRSFNESPNLLENLRDYWIEMGAFAKENGFKVQMFEAFDEPWKSSEKNLDPSGLSAEAHYGWWRLVDNDDLSTFIEKVSGKVIKSRATSFVINTNIMLCILGVFTSILISSSKIDFY